MEDISNITLVPLQKQQYIKPLTMVYTQNGVENTWDILEFPKAVCILLLNTTRNVLVFVKQFRPPVYLDSVPENERCNGKVDSDKYPGNLGVTIELCAGIIDKDMPMEQIAAEEINEECGYAIDPDCLEFICSFTSSTDRNGSTSATLYLFYAEITDAMIVSEGGGVGNEMIGIVEMTIEEARSYINQKTVQSPPAFLFAINWFIANKIK